jgi:cysteine desulfurase
MTVNNEIGVIQPVAELTAICGARGVWVHSDTAQALRRVPLDVAQLGVNILSLSGHKCHGTKGIGALDVGTRPRVRLGAILSGGRQERGMRSGTLAVPLIVGFGKAAEIARREMAADTLYIEALGRYLIDRVRATIPEVTVNGSEVSHWFGCVNISFNSVEGESLISKIPKFAVSSGQRLHLSIARALLCAPRNLSQRRTRTHVAEDRILKVHNKRRDR